MVVVVVADGAAAAVHSLRTLLLHCCSLIKKRDGPTPAGQPYMQVLAMRRIAEHVRAWRLQAGTAVRLRKLQAEQEAKGRRELAAQGDQPAQGLDQPRVPTPNGDDPHARSGVGDDSLRPVASNDSTDSARSTGGNSSDSSDSSDDGGAAVIAAAAVARVAAEQKVATASRAPPSGSDKSTVANQAKSAPSARSPSTSNSNGNGDSGGNGNGTSPAALATRAAASGAVEAAAKAAAAARAALAAMESDDDSDTSEVANALGVSTVSPGTDASKLRALPPKLPPPPPPAL